MKPRAINATVTVLVYLLFATVAIGTTWKAANLSFEGKVARADVRAQADRQRELGRIATGFKRLPRKLQLKSGRRFGEHLAS